MQDPYKPRGLTKLWGDLPSMAKAQVSSGKSHAVASAQRFTRMCPICGLMFERTKLFTSPELKMAECQGCKEKLADGSVAFITASRRFAIVKFNPALKERLLELSHVENLPVDDAVFIAKLANAAPGGTVTLSDDEMNALEKFHAQGN